MSENRWEERTRGTIMVRMEGIGSYPLSLSTGSFSDYFMGAYQIMKAERISMDQVRRFWRVESFSGTELVVKRIVR